MKICSIVRGIIRYFISVCLKPVLIVLALSAFDAAIRENVLNKLWGIANIEKGWDVTILVACISAFLLCCGWKQYRCLHDKKQISYYFLACGIYFLYLSKWDYIDTHYWVDCWSSLLAAYPIGMALHWLFDVTLSYYRKVCKGGTQKDAWKWTVPAMVMLEDAPVDNVDADEFRYKGNAQRIARTVIERKGISSYSIGITGAWGAGKTSMLNLIKFYLKKEDSVIIIDFNPRESAGVSCIQMDFLTVVANKLKEYHTGTQAVMADYMRALRVLTGNSIWSKIIEVARFADSEISKKSVEEVINMINKKIVIFIDDFDRLTGEEILEVLKIVDKNGSFRHTIFISAYDKEYVNGVLRNYLGDNTTRDFTDKFFNLELRLPDRKQFHKNGFIQRRFHALVKSGVIKNYTKNQVDDALSAIVGFMDIYMPTVRDIKRYIGLTMASYVEVQDDVVLRDFLLVNLIKYKYPHEYDALYKHCYFSTDYFAESHATNYLLRDEKSMSEVRSYPVMKLLFPVNASVMLTNKKFGYKHLSWKRSFDYYFFDQELGHIPSKLLIPLANPQISLLDFKERTSEWTSNELRQDVVDFVISRSEMVHTASEFEDYLRLLVMARYYSPIYELYLQCCRLMAKKSHEDNIKKFNITKEEYLSIIDKFINRDNEWVLSAVFLQDALHCCLKPGDELDLIYEHTYLKKVAEDRLRYVLKAFKAQRATSEDVYEVLKANVVEVEGGGVNVLSPKALERVRKDMIENARLYFSDIVWHKPVQGSETDIVIGFHEHMPVRDLFKNKEQFGMFLNEVDKVDGNMSKATSCLMEIYERFSANRYEPVRIRTKYSNRNISQCDFEEYNLIFEGER